MEGKEAALKFAALVKWREAKETWPLTSTPGGAFVL